MAKKLINLEDVIGHNSIVNWFKGCIERDALPQVIMIQGPTGIGKTSIAKIVACEIAYMNYPDRLGEAKKAVIMEDKSTDAVRLYNMSNLKSQEAVHEVKSDLAIGFSSTGRKVIIMDEAHGMSDEAQDSLLTAFESLQSQVYIIVCSTELSSFREAFVGRCLLRRLTNLSLSEMKKLLRNRIEDNELSFELPLNVVYSLISIYTGRDPRKALNLLDSFEPGHTVTKEELNTFVNIYENKELTTLIGYLYDGNVLAGLDFISDCELGSTFTSTLLELVKVAEGGTSPLFCRDESAYIVEMVKGIGLRPLITFSVDVATCTRLSRNLLSGFYLKACLLTSKSYSEIPEKMSPEQVQIRDLPVMQTMLEKRDEVHVGGNEMRAMSSEALVSESEVVE